MSLSWKLRERLTVLTLGAGLVPLLFTIIYVGHQATVLLKNQAEDYLEAKVSGFAQMVEIRNNAVKNNLDIIREQLTKNLKDDIVKQAAQQKYYESGHLLIFNSAGLCIYHSIEGNKNNSNLYNSKEWVRKGISLKKGVFSYSDDGTEMIAFLAYNPDFDWIMWGEAPAKEILADVNTLKWQMYFFMLVISVLIAFAGVIVSQTIAKNAKVISDRMMNIASGDADLSARLPVLSKDEIGEIANWFNKFLEKLEDVISQVKLTALQVDAATQEVASGSLGLSQATQEQASSIEEVAATIEEMTSSIKQNANNATEGRQKAMDMVQMANTSGEVSQELVRGMSEISEASKKIGDIIVTVNEVAFQTNLLALNAAVEAARAGEHGKGFAVVAEEVRALAQRSADAARQIKNLIIDTVNKIKAGDEMVKRSGESLEKIMTHIHDLAQTMDEIAASSSEQASGVDEVNRAIAQIDSTTQENATTIEELAGTSDSLSTEARDLSNIVSKFKVSKTERTSTTASPLKNKQPRNNKQIQKTKPKTSDRTTMDKDDFEEF